MNDLKPGFVVNSIPDQVLWAAVAAALSRYNTPPGFAPVIPFWADVIEAALKAAERQWQYL